MDEMKAIIAGTGFDEEIQNGRKEIVKTKYGNVKIVIGDNFIFLPRHGEGHIFPPHKINYLANVTALKTLGIKKTVGIYAVGSITEKIKPQEWGFIDQFIDFSGRNLTLFDDMVVHTSMSEPFSKKETNKLYIRAKELFNRNFSRKVTYVNTNGPRLETSAEILAYKIMGGDVVGMTGGTEASLLKEAGIKHVGISYSINWAAGIEDNISFVEKKKRVKIKEEIKRLLAIEKMN